MTRPSELFHPRRSRLGRGSEPLLLGYSSTASNRYSGRTRRRRNGHSDLNSFDYPPWRSHFRPPSINQDVGESSQSNHRGPAAGFREPIIDQLNGNENGRLSGAVLLARARLLERLRGMSLAESRASVGTNREFIFGYETTIPDGRFDNSVWHLDDSHLETESGQSIQRSYKSKPPGLTSSEIDLLPSEIFSNDTDFSEGSHALSDCSICLDSFSVGDKIIHLPCDHTYHFVCLEPWVRACGDCPNCRTDIIAASSSLNTDETRGPS